MPIIDYDKLNIYLFMGAFLTFTMTYIYNRLCKPRYTCNAFFAAMMTASLLYGIMWGFDVWIDIGADAFRTTPKYV